MLTQLPETLLVWIQQYGLIALFFLLALGIIALPIPDETLLVTTGFLISKGKLSLIPTTLTAILGAWAGITISYCLGFYVGPYIMASRVGEFFGLRGQRFIQAKEWFQRVGKWSLVFGYFIPGFRHFFGYIAGLLQFPYRQFGLFAYSGGALWASLFLTIGYAIQNHENLILKWVYHIWDMLSRLIK